MKALNADVSEKAKHMIIDAKTMGNVPTFPAVFDIITAEPLADIYGLINHKKNIEINNVNQELNVFLKALG